jgi:hypothetical protein
LTVPVGDELSSKGIFPIDPLKNTHFYMGTFYSYVNVYQKVDP